MLNQTSEKSSLTNRLLAGLFFGLGVSLSIGAVSFWVYLVLAAVPPGTTNPTGPPGAATDVSWAPLYVDPVNQRVGVGTTSPNYPLSVAQNYFGVGGEGDIVVTGGTDGRWGLFKEPGTNEKIGIEANGNLILVSSGGNVGIGTTNPVGRFQVAGGAAFERGGKLLAFDPNTGAGNTNAQIKADSGMDMDFYTDSSGFGGGTLVLHLDTSGSVGIMTASPASRLDLAGGCMTGSICSDVRMKENILPMSENESYISKLTQLQGVSFEWKHLEDKKRYFGLIAQDVEKVIPEVVTTDAQNQEQKGLSCTGLDAVLIEAIKEQQEEINVLKQEISILKTRY